MTLKTLLLKIGADTSDLNRKLDAALDRVGKVGEGFARVGRGLTTYVTLPIVGIGAAAVKSAIDMDTLTRSLYAVTENKSSIDAQMKSLREIAKLPGLGFKDAVQGSIRLQAVGFSAERAQTALKGLGKAISSTGGGKVELDRVTLQLAQMGAAGKILMTDLRPIITQVPIIATTMQKAFGTIDPTELNKKFKNSTEFIDALMVELGKLDGATSGPKIAVENLGDSMFFASNAIGQAITPTLVPLIDKLTDMLNTLSKANPEVIKFGVIIGGLLAVLGPLIVGINAVVSALVGLRVVSGTVALFTTLRAALAAGQLAWLGYGSVISRVWASVVAFGAVLGPIALGVAALVAVLNTARLVHKYWGAISFEIEHLDDTLAKRFPRMAAGIKALTFEFKSMYDKVVGHSYVPDMIAGIDSEFKKLDTIMVNPANNAVTKTNNAFKGLSKDTLSRVMQRYKSDIESLKDAKLDLILETDADKADKLKDRIAELNTEIAKLAPLVKTLEPPKVNRSAADKLALGDAGNRVNALAAKPITDPFSDAFKGFDPKLVDDVIDRYTSGVERLRQLRLDLVFEKDGDAAAGLRKDIATLNAELTKLKPLSEGLDFRRRLDEAHKAALAPISTDRMKIEPLVTVDKNLSKPSSDPASEAAWKKFASTLKLIDTTAAPLPARFDALDFAMEKFHSNFDPFIDMIKSGIAKGKGAVADPGGALKGIAAAGLDIVGTGLSAALGAVMASIGPFAILMKFIDGALETLGPVIEKLLAPVEILGNLFGAVLIPIIDALSKPMRLLAKISTYVTEGLGWLIRALGKAINFLLPGNPANGLVSFGQNMMDQAKAARTAIDATAKMATTVEDVNKQFEKLQSLNIPEIFKLQSAVLSATKGESKAPAAYHMTPSKATASAPTFIDQSVTYNEGAVQINGMNKSVAQIHEESLDYARKKSQNKTGTTANARMFQ